MFIKLLFFLGVVGVIEGSVFGGDGFAAEKLVSEVDSSDAAVGVDLYPEGFDVICSVGSSGEVGEVEVDLVPSFIELHWDCADEWLYPCVRLII